MTPENIITDLSARLRGQGVAFNLADLEAFSSTVRRTPAGGHDIEALVERFREAQRIAAESARKQKCAQAWREGAYFAGTGVVLLGLGAWCWTALASAEVGSPARLTATLLGICGFTAGAALAIAGLMVAVRGSRAAR